jgi:hypothetical protein
MTVMRIKVDGGSDQYVEVEVDTDSDEVRPLAANRAEPLLADTTLDAALGTVKRALSVVVGQLKTVDPAVDEIDVQVGLRVGGETGLLIVRGMAEATFAITMTWRRPARGTPGGEQRDDAVGS